jgi:hypothetical protein
MNDRYKWAMAALVASALSAGLWLVSHDRGSEPTGHTERHVRPARAALRETRRASTRPAPEPAACDLDCIERARKATREARVVEALARLERRTGNISRETIESEQAHLAATAQALHARETEMPSIEDEVDESGMRWKKLAYADGSVRYALPEEP